MRILCVTPWFPTHRHDHCGSYIFDSVLALLRLGYEVIVLVTHSWQFSNHKIAFEFSHTHLKIYRCRNLSIPRGYFSALTNLFYQFHVGKIVKELAYTYQCHLIHAHTERAGLAAVVVSRKISIPAVVTLHGISTDVKLYRFLSRKRLFEYTLNNIDRVILVGKPILTFFKRYVKNTNHFSVVANGCRCTEMKPKANNKLQSSTIRFISVSQLQEGKGIEINLQALAKLNDCGINSWTYGIIGDGSEKKRLQQRVKKLYLSDQVTFHGKCPHNEVYDHLNQADVFILPSYREAFGIAYLEAMACGLLTIGVQGQGPSEFIEQDKTGLLVKPYCVENLATTIQQIFKSLPLMQQIARAGQKHVYQKYTWQAHGEKLVAIYKECIEKYDSDRSNDN